MYIGIPLFCAFLYLLFILVNNYLYNKYFTLIHINQMLINYLYNKYMYMGNEREIERKCGYKWEIILFG